MIQKICLFLLNHLEKTIDKATEEYQGLIDEMHNHNLTQPEPSPEVKVIENVR